LLIVQRGLVPVHPVPVQLTNWKFVLAGVAVTVTLPPASTEQLAALQLGVRPVTTTLPSAAGAAVALTVKMTGAKVAVSVSPLCVS
jgi:hypothetical protein